MATPVDAAERLISGDHLDRERDWVAELACCHNQHVVRSQKGCSAEQIR